jgi:hypothetical protein
VVSWIAGRDHAGSLHLARITELEYERVSVDLHQGELESDSMHLGDIGSDVAEWDPDYSSDVRPLHGVYRYTLYVITLLSMAPVRTRGSPSVSVKKGRDAQDTAILHGLERASYASRRKWLFVEEIVPMYRLAAEALRVPCLHQSTVVRRLERLADQRMVLVVRKPKSVNWRGRVEERQIAAYRLAFP